MLVLQVKNQTKGKIYILYLQETRQELYSSCNYKKYYKRIRGIRYHGYKYTENIKNSGKY
jgi:hypothetical protein